VNGGTEVTLETSYEENDGVLPTAMGGHQTLAGFGNALCSSEVDGGEILNFFEILR
jgi:hypothetical protein